MTGFFAGSNLFRGGGGTQVPLAMASSIIRRCLRRNTKDRITMAADTPSSKIKVAVRHPIQYKDCVDICGKRRSYQERCKLRKEDFSLRLEGTRLAW